MEVQLRHQKADGEWTGMSDSCGAGGTRTPYLILAKDALSLMSYSPTITALAESLESRKLLPSTKNSASLIVRRTDDKKKGPSYLDPYLNRWTVKGNLEFLCKQVSRCDRNTE